MSEHISEIITLCYKNSNNNNRILGKDFVLKNSNNFKLIVNGKEYSLTEHIKDICNNSINNENIVVKLKQIKSITNLSNMFYECEPLIFLSGIENLNTSNVDDMSMLFYGCRQLVSLPDISLWNTSNVKKMFCMFFQCESLKSLPDISVWNTHNVIDMKYIFNECKNTFIITKYIKMGYF